VQFNGSNPNQVVPSLASSWTVSSNSENYSFTMRANTWFSNKDPINAYVAWFSFLRVNYMNAPTTVGYSNYVDLLYSPNNAPDAAGNVWPWGLQNAINSVFKIPVSNENQQVKALNNVLSHFNTANASIQALMAYPHQALVATSATSFTMNLIQPYALYLLDLPPQWGALVDPVYIDANGGVANNTIVPTFNTNGMPGSGPYQYGTVGSGNSQLVLNANPNYWAIGVSGLAPVLAPPPIKTVIMNFGLEPNTQIEDFGTNSVALAAPPISEFQQAYNAYQDKAYFKFNQLFANLGYPLCDLASGMNTQKAPTNNTDFRQAVVHAINYTEIQQQLYSFNGTILGELFIPPVPPGFGPLDNPQNISLYSTNINLAASYMNQAGIQGGFYTIMQNGTTLGDAKGTALAPVAYDYIVPLTPQLQTLLDIMQANLAQIGVTLAPTGVTTGVYDADLTTAQTAPPITGVGWCADWPDPIFQQFLDMGVYSVAHQPNWVNNATLTALLFKIPFETNAAQQLADTEKAYQIFTQLATIIQQPNSAIYYWKQPYVQGLTYQPFEFALYYNMISYKAVTASSAG